MRRLLFTLLLLSVPHVVRADDAIDRPLARAIAQAFTQSRHAGPQRDAELQRLEAERLAQERANRAQLDLATAVFAGVAGADWAVTAVCFKVRCSDKAGYSASYFVGGEGFKEPAVAALMGLGLDALIVVGVREFIAEEHPKLAQSILWIASGVRVVIVFNKVSDLRQHAVRAP